MNLESQRLLLFHDQKSEAFPLDTFCISDFVKENFQLSDFDFQFFPDPHRSTAIIYFGDDNFLVFSGLHEFNLKIRFRTIEAQIDWRPALHPHPYLAEKIAYKIISCTVIKELDF